MNQLSKLLVAACGIFVLVPAGCDKQAEPPKAEKRATAKKSNAVKETAPVEKTTVREPAAKPSAKKPAPAKPAADGAAETAEAPAEPAAPAAQVVIEDASPATAGILAPDPLAPSPAEVPPVTMSQQHADSCLVKVGDVLPAAQLADLSGQQRDLQKLLGDRLTIVFVWTAANRQSIDELRDMAERVASPLAPLGVRVVGICERDTADAAQSVCDKAGVSFPVLLDADGKYYAQLATSSIPRTYLLDSSGKILWFDIEYGGATRRDLRQALQALLPQQN